jgi:hypothetical protein
MESMASVKVKDRAEGLAFSPEAIKTRSEATTFTRGAIGTLCAGGSEITSEQQCTDAATFLVVHLLVRVHGVVIPLVVGSGKGGIQTTANSSTTQMFMEAQVHKYTQFAPIRQVSPGTHMYPETVCLVTTSSPSRIAAKLYPSVLRSATKRPIVLHLSLALNMVGRVRTRLAIVILKIPPLMGIAMEGTTI